MPRPPIVVHGSGTWEPADWVTFMYLMWGDLKAEIAKYSFQPGDNVEFTYNGKRYKLKYDWFASDPQELNFHLLRVMYEDDMVVQGLLDILEGK